MHSSWNNKIFSFVFDVNSMLVFEGEKIAGFQGVAIIKDTDTNMCFEKTCTDFAVRRGSGKENIIGLHKCNELKS